MKMMISFCVCIFATTAGIAQGTVYFANYVAFFSMEPIVDAPFFDERGLRLAGPSYVAQLYGWKTGDGFQPVGIPVPFASDGYFDGRQVRLPFVPLGGPVWVQVRTWLVAGGATFEQAALAGAWAGVSTILFVPYTGNAPGAVARTSPPTLPAQLIGLQYPGSPLLVRHPQAQSVRSGNGARLSVLASSGVQMTYQWYQNRSDRPDRLIVGATNNVYTTPMLSTNTAFWVSIANSAGSVLSDRALVTVVAVAPRLTLTRVAGLSSLSLDGPAGFTYRIEFSTDLSANNWVNLLGLSLYASPVTFIDSGASNTPARFYRAVVP